METTFWIELLLIAVAILANGLFAGAEFALVSSRISRLAELRQSGVRGAAAAFELAVGTLPPMQTPNVGA
jgi:putative hemolysin